MQFSSLFCLFSVCGPKVRVAVFLSVCFFSVCGPKLRVAFFFSVRWFSVCGPKLRVAVFVHNCFTTSSVSFKSSSSCGDIKSVTISLESSSFFRLLLVRNKPESLLKKH